MKIITVRDSREHTGKGWTFPDMEIYKLDCGDYSIKGLENIFSIERKNSIDEIYMNIGSKKNKERFLRELDILKSYKYKFIIIEGTVPQMLYGSRYSRLKPDWVMRELNKIELDYGIPIKFIEKGDASLRYASMLIESVASKEFGEKCRLYGV